MSKVGWALPTTFIDPDRFMVGDAHPTSPRRNHSSLLAPRFSVSWCTLATAVLAAFANGVSAAPDTAFERWYSVLIQNKPVGWLHTTETTREQQITSEMSMRLELRRGPSLPKIEVKIRFDETPDGKPIRSELVQNLGLLKSKQTAFYNDDGTELVIEQADQVQRKSFPRSTQAWLTPAAAGRYIEKQIAEGDKEIRFWSVDPMGGVEPFETKMVMLGRENVDVRGKVVPAVLWDVRTSLLPGMVTRVYSDEVGRDIKTTMTLLPGMSFEIIEADEQIARQQVDPPEILVSTFVRPDKPIANPRKQRSAIYELTFERDDSEDTVLQIPRTGYQRVVWNDSRTAAVAVSLDRPVAPGDDLPDESHKHASSILNHEDPKIRELVRHALADAPEELSTAAKAEHLRQYVRAYVKTANLRVGFATASEVARTAEGDCTEHAVLLAAMLRAEGIPSRTVGGLIYVANAFIGQTNIFGYHMWTQAWLPADVGDSKTGRRWVDLDATRMTPFDAAHITLSVSAMDDRGLLNDMLSLVPMLGRLSIKVIESH